MKKELKILFLLFIAVLTAGSMTAQEKQTEKRGDKISREELAVAQAQNIAKKLSFDESTTQKFIETYQNCQKEIWALGSKPEKRAAITTDAEAEKAIKARFERSRKMLDIREKYYTEYSKFLTQLQINEVYKLERKMMDRLAKNKQSVRQGRKGGRPGQRGNRQRPPRN